jgi:hypothetical protein
VVYTRTNGAGMDLDKYNEFSRTEFSGWHYWYDFVLNAIIVVCILLIGLDDHLTNIPNKGKEIHYSPTATVTRTTIVWRYLMLLANDALQRDKSSMPLLGSF